MGGTTQDFPVTSDPEQEMTWFGESQPEYGVSAINNSSDDYYTSEYEYDYVTSVETIPLDELVPVGIIYGLTFLLGITGNSLVIFTICRHRRLQSPTNIFLVSLATADLLLVLVCIPIKLVKWFTFTWELGEVLCKLVHYIQNVSALCSVLTLTAMSMERYYAILHPMRAKYRCTISRARRVVILLWAVSLILATPILQGQIHKKVGKYRFGYWCMEEWSRALYEQIYDLSMLFVILIIPVSMMSFAYASICRELWVVATVRASMRVIDKRDRDEVDITSSLTRNGVQLNRRSRAPPQGSRNDNNVRRQVVKMLVAVIVLFVICWTPLLVDNVLVAFGLLDRLHYGPLKPLRQAFAIMAYTNSSVNPIVYAFMSKSFRESFRVALCTCFKGNAYRNQERRRQMLAMQTNSISFSAGRPVYGRWQQYRMNATRITGSDKDCGIEMEGLSMT